MDQSLLLPDSWVYTREIKYMWTCMWLEIKKIGCSIVKACYVILMKIHYYMLNAMWLSYNYKISTFN